MKAYELKPRPSDFVTVDETNTLAPNAAWTLLDTGFNGYYSILGPNNKFLSRCTACWGNSATTLETVLTHCPVQDSSTSLFTPIDLGNGKWAFKGDNGKFLTRCPSCTKNGDATDYLSISWTDSSQPASRWTVLPVFPTTGYITLSNFQTGLYLEPRVNTVPTGSVSVNGNNSTLARWRVQVVNDSVAFRDIAERAAGICTSCWNK